MVHVTLLHVIAAGLLVAPPCETLGILPKKGQKLRLQRRLEGGPAPPPPLEKGEAVNGHWVKSAGNGDWIKEAGNVYRKVPGVGSSSGGTCTCPDGEVYKVGDMGDNCTNLACEGGQAGQCTEGGIDEESAGMMVSCARPPVGEGGARNDGHHHSIFQLHLSSLDNEDFWKVFIGMILFAIAVDQSVEWMNHYTESSPTTALFLERVYSELMLFGIVALLIFITENLVGEITEGTHLIVEFVDILCSVGAISLILFACIIYAVLKRDEAHWKDLEVATSPLSEEAATYQMIAQAFKKEHGLSQSFPMSTYLRRTLVHECVHIMRVEWTSWMLFALLPAAGFGYRKYRGESLSDQEMFFFVMRLNWIVFLVHLVIVATLQYAYGVIEECIHGEAKPWSPAVMKYIAFFIQFVAIVNSFLFALYIMTCMYNAQFTDKPLFNVVADGLPLVINIVIMLPVILTFMAPVQAYFSPNKEAIGAIMEDIAKVGEDMAFLRKAYNDQGHQTPRAFRANASMNKKDFKRLLEKLNVHMTSARSTRLFDVLDADSSGQISEAEFYKKIRPARVQHATTFGAADSPRIVDEEIAAS